MKSVLQGKKYGPPAPPARRGVPNDNEGRFGLQETREVQEVDMREKDATTAQKV